MSEKKLKKYVVPETKKELIAAINEKGIADIICTSQILDGEVLFSLEIRTKDEKIFHFGQNVVMRPVFGRMEVLDMSTGNCHDVEVNMGKGFDSKTYKYPNTPWSLEASEDA